MLVTKISDKDAAKNKFMIQTAETDLKPSEQLMVSGFWEVQKKSTENKTKSEVMKIVIEEILPSRPNRFAKVAAPSDYSESQFSMMSKVEK
jgi:hypothetical protein